MSLQKLRIYYQVPPQGFRHRCKQCTRPLITAPTWDELLIAIRKHEENNGHEITSVEEIEDQLCQLLPNGHCQYEDGTQPSGHGCNVNGEEMLAGAKGLAGMAGHWIAGLFNGKGVWVGQEEANRRANICARCPRNVSATACASCWVVTHAKDLLFTIKGEKSTPDDNALDQCCVCHCDCKTIVWIRKDILLEHMTNEQKERSPKCCWKLEP